MDSPVRAEMRDPRVRHVIIAVLPHPPPQASATRGTNWSPWASHCASVCWCLVCSRGPRTIRSGRSKHIATQATGDCEIEGRRATQPPLRNIDVSRAASLCSGRCAGRMVAEPVRDPIAQGAVALSSCNREPQAEAQECTEGVGFQPQTKCLGRAGRAPCTGTGFLQNPKVGAASLAISLREQGVSFGFIQSC